MTRKFPSYTLQDLKSFSAEGVTDLRDINKVEEINKEIAARESGSSFHKITPQVAW